jgi:hypothetical protein
MAFPPPRRKQQRQNPSATSNRYAFIARQNPFLRYFVLAAP